MFTEQLMAGRKQHIVTYGTSLTAGGAWVEQLRDLLDARFPGLVTVTNSGMGAMWSTWGAENLTERVLAFHPDVVTLEFASNDAYLPYATSIETARANLALMIDRILHVNLHAEIILLTMNPPTGPHLEARPNYAAYYQLYRDMARERGLLLIDIEPAWQALLERDAATFYHFIPDGIHPNALGCEEIIIPAIAAALCLGACD